MLPSYDFSERVYIKKRHIAAILFANAIISLVISVAVYQTMPRFLQARTTPQATKVAPAAMVTPPLTPSEKPNEITYVVKPGDTLSDIAFKHDSSVEAIMRANNLSNADLLYAGQKLIIPLGIALTPSPTPISIVIPSPEGETATGAPPPEQVQVEIVTIVLSLPGSLLESPEGEMVILHNSREAVNLKGWTLTNSRGDVYTFPDFPFARGMSLALHTEEGKDTTTDLYWGRETAAWHKGDDKATLADAEQRVVDIYELR